MARNCQIVLDQRIVSCAGTLPASSIGANVLRQLTQGGELGKEFVPDQRR